MPQSRRPRKPHVPRFKAFVDGFTKIARDVAVKEVRAFADKARESFVERIKAQRFKAFKAFPLSWVTLAKKRRYNLSLKTMIATGSYIRAIKVYVETKPGTSGNVTQIIVGIHPRVRARDVHGRVRPQVAMQDVARINEFGAPRAHIPARPHWWPHYLRLHEDAPAVRQRIARLVRQRWLGTIRAKGS